MSQENGTISITGLKNRRNGHKGQITKIEKRITEYIEKGHFLEDIPVLEDLKRDLERQFVKFEELHMLIVGRDDENVNVQTEEEELDQVTTRIMKSKGELSKLINELKREGNVADHEAIARAAATAAIAASSSASSTRIKPTVKLPKLDLPTFSGSYTEWNGFLDLFDASVASNKDLSDVQKLQYLKASLRGDALQVISSLQITAANFNTALSLLDDRYSNPRQIVRSHLRGIFNAPFLKQENAATLRKLIETIEEHRLALKNLGQPVDKWDAILVYIVGERLDPETKKQWELSDTNKDIQKYKDLQDYLLSRVRALETGPCKKPGVAVNSGSSRDRHQVYQLNFDAKKKDNKDSGNKIYTPVRPQLQTQSQTKALICSLCGQAHRITQCSKFKDKNPVECRDIAILKRLCFNCLSPTHSIKDCQSSISCQKCEKRHHTFLHFESPPRKLTFASVRGQGETSSSSESSTSFHSASTQVSQAANDKSTVLLGTAIIPITLENGRQVKVRALLDTGSQLSFVTESLVQRLQLQRHQTEIQISTVCSNDRSSEQLVKNSVDLKIQPVHKELLQLKAYVLKRLTKKLPNQNIVINSSQELNSIKLADPSFCISSAVDLLLGADVYDIIVGSGKINLPQGLCARSTIFGWIVTGLLSSGGFNQSKEVFHVSVDSFPLQRFWELENIPQAQPLTVEERACERHFDSTTKRNQDGRFVVKLPFKKNAVMLGNSKPQAMRRLAALEKRLSYKPELRKQYCQFIDEFISLGHLEEIPANELVMPEFKTFYMPHHCVFKESSTTTKLRVVFDASAKTSNGQSLNNSLMVGPRLQDDLLDILLRFRIHPIALSADVAKMYRQVCLDDADKDYHRILWRASPIESIKEYRMTRVTYGVASSAYHSIRCLQEVGALATNQNVSRLLKRDFYVDDILTGAPSIEEANDIINSLRKTMLQVGFDLRKWSSNSAAVLDFLPKELHEDTSCHPIKDEDHAIKALGMSWKPSFDTFTFTNPASKFEQSPITKRRLLSFIASIFDPLGFLTPITVTLKALMQKTWLEGLGWDDEIPSNIVNAWTKLSSELKDLECLSIPRHVSPCSSTKFQLHVFADASEIAYAATIYVRSVDNSNISSRLLVAKSRIAPVKAVSLPRLELCAAHLACKLYICVSSALSRLNVTFEDVYAWTDSTIVLAWLCDYPRRWTTFVANRVSDIQDKLPPDKWRHVASADNPADISSRGISISTLKTNSLWWNGPTWLTKPPDSWPITKNLLCESIPETRKVIATVCQTQSDSEDIIAYSRFSSLYRLKRAFVYVLRFCDFFNRNKERHVGELSTEEIERAFLVMLRNVQEQHFYTELSSIRVGNQIPSKSSLLSLTPFIDVKSGLLKVSGRLVHSNLPEETKHGILLPKKHTLSELIVKEAHYRTLHGGPSLTMSTVRSQFWIPSLRSLVNKVVRSCVKCIRFSKLPSAPMMGQLPRDRVTPSRPFTHTGIDYGGPLQIKSNQLRNSKIIKAYFAVFVCFATRAVHLEAVSDCSSPACLAAIRRFVSRRGLPRTIYSDNASTFEGADGDLQDLQNLHESNVFRNDFQMYLTQHSVKWLMIPPRAPHFGGLWEAAVKKVKYHLRRVVGNQVLTFEELSTFLCQVEASINSRPLQILPSSADDPQALTPGHFLIGESLLSIPQDPSLDELSRPPHHRWKLIQHLFNLFWKAWKRDYLVSLQPKSKWMKPSITYKPGDIVLVIEDNVPPLKWPLARIIELAQGKDGISRVALIKTSTSTLKRPIVKLKLLYSVE